MTTGFDGGCGAVDRVVEALRLEGYDDKILFHYSATEGVVEALRLEGYDD